MSFQPVYGGQGRCNSSAFTPVADIRYLFFLPIVVFLALFGTSAYSQENQDQYGLFYRLINADTGFDQRAIGLQSDYQLMIDGPFARATITQTFDNQSDDWREAVYKFPLPSGAAVDGLRVRIGDREIIGVIDKKEEARERYEEARDNGQAAALLSSVRENMFNLSIANIPPRQQVHVEIGFDAPVDRQGLTYRLMMPLVLAPRYERDAGEGGFVAPSEIHVPLDHSGDPNANGVTITANLRPGAVPDFIRSTSHKIKVTEIGDVWQVTLDGAAQADRVYSLEWKLPVAAAPKPTVFLDDTGHALMRLLPPDQAGDWANSTPLPPREVVLVLDRSGSMDGDPIKQAHAALRRALDSLRPIDRVNVIAFDDKLDVLFDQPKLATDDVLRQAHTFIKRADARGGTEMLPAMVAALAGDVPDGMIRQVVLATDALIGYEDSILQDIARLRGDARIFPIAIGAAPNDMLIRWASDVGQGAAVFITYGDPIEERMNELLARLSRPALTDIQVDWSVDGVDTLPSAIPDLFYGEPLQVSAKMDGQPNLVSVSGRLGDRDWSYTITADQFVRLGAGQTIRRAYGKAKLAEMRRVILSVPYDQDHIREEAVNIATDHAIRYGLVSPYTSLIAVEQTVSRPTDEGLATEAVPSVPPAGADHFAPQMMAAPAALQQRAMVRVGLPQTATPAPLLVLIGMVIMGFGLLVLLRRRII